MSNFNIDEQTFRDLNIFTKNVGSNSIFDLFKGTRTVGGRERLREMMQCPSSDLEEITLRRDSIKYFYDYRINLDVRNEELDLVEFYLKFDKRKFRSNFLDSLSEYITRNSSNDYYIIRTGLKYLIKLTKYIAVFIKEYSLDDAPEYIQTIFEQIELIIEEGQLKQTLSYNENKLEFLQVSKLDRAFRGKEKENIKTLLTLVYELDIFENISKVASAKGFSFPKYRDEDKLQVRLNGLFHPNISHPVKNDLLFDIDQNIVFLTGSNMAGKSSLLKSIGLVIYLSHLGFPVPADEMETTIFNGLITTINLPDNINEGLSHYYSEVRRVKEVSEKLLKNDKMFVIFDELFRGTNVKDAFDASSLIISELAAVRNSAFFISTHIVELADELKKFNNISFSYLQTHFENEKPIFTYQLTEGVSEERLGMFIILNEGIVDIIRKASGREL
jgi:DNA mismatch repair protein MutS